MKSCLDSELVYKAFIKYITLVNDYLIYCSNNLPINENYHEYVYNGLMALKHVFIILISKTHNSDYANEIMQKCYIYYIEFLTQVSKTDNQLNLTPFDAVMFIYKKSLFNYETNKEDEYKLNLYTTGEIEMLESLSIFHLNYFNYYIQSSSSKKIEVFTKNIYLITENIIYVNNKPAVNYITEFTRCCYTKEIDYFKFTESLISFIKVISKKHSFQHDNTMLVLEENKVFQCISAGEIKKITKLFNTFI